MISQGLGPYDVWWILSKKPLSIPPLFNGPEQECWNLKVEIFSENSDDWWQGKSPSCCSF